VDHLENTIFLAIKNFQYFRSKIPFDLINLTICIRNSIEAWQGGNTLCVDQLSLVISIIPIWISPDFSSKFFSREPGYH
jgi:hypothetical protein